MAQGQDRYYVDTFDRDGDICYSVYDRTDFIRTDPVFDGKGKKTGTKDKHWPICIDVGEEAARFICARLNA